MFSQHVNHKRNHMNALISEVDKIESWLGLCLSIYVILKSQSKLERLQHRLSFMEEIHVRA
jgi:ribosome-associated toxin RatA of RatAB toxin-antitoxin module